MLNDWHVVAVSAEIVPGHLVPLILFERELVGWRDSGGAMHVWEDLCIHRGARLSKGFIRDDKVICPYHGWNYDGSARCVLMPAAPSEAPLKKARAIAHHTTEKYGLLWVCLGTPERDVPEFPEWTDDGYKKVLCGPYKFRSGFRAVENFVDPTHFPFVHAGVNGDPRRSRPILPYEVREDSDGLSTSEIRVTQPFGDRGTFRSPPYYAYKCLRPLVAYFKKRVVISDPGARLPGQFRRSVLHLPHGPAGQSRRKRGAHLVRHEFLTFPDGRRGAAAAGSGLCAGQRHRRHAAPGAHSARAAP